MSVAVAPIACESCRRCHRKCSRDLPSCSYCTEKNKKCMYPDPLSRSRTTKPNKMVVFRDVTQKYIANVRNDGVVSPPSHAEVELARHNTVCIQVDVALEDLSFYMPVIALDKARDIMLYIRDVMNCGKRRGVDAPVTGELALVFAIQATSYIRTGKSPIANMLYEKARELILPVFDMVDENFDVAACYACLAQFLISLGEPDKASFFIRNAKKYVNRRNRPMHQFKERVLDWSIMSSMQLLTPDEDLIERLRHFNVYLDREEDRLGEVHNLETIDNTYNRIIKMLNHNVTPTADNQSKKLYFYAIAQGAKLQFLRRNEWSDPLLSLELANNISSLVESDLYPICHAMIFVSVLEATRIHIETIVQVPTLELIERLKQDLKGLEIMATRHAILRMRYSEFIKKLQDQIAFHDEVFKNVVPLSILEFARVI